MYYLSETKKINAIKRMFISEKNMMQVDFVWVMHFIS